MNVNSLKMFDNGSKCSKWFKIDVKDYKSKKWLKWIKIALDGLNKPLGFEILKNGLSFQKKLFLFKNF